MSITDATTGGAAYPYRLRYETLRSLLNRNNRSLQLLSDLEADLNHLRYSSDQVKRPVERLIEEALLMAQECNLLSGDRQRGLYEVIFEILRETNELFGRPTVEERTALVVELGSDEAIDAALVGGKAAGVAMLMRRFGDRVPGGFVVTTAAYQMLLERNGLDDRIRLLLKDHDTLFDRARYRSMTTTVREWIRSAEVPSEVGEAIRQQAGGTPGVGPTGWAVRSSAVLEGGASSFAGLFVSELRVAAERLATAYLNVIASRFLDRAVLYRIQRGIREVDTPMAVLFMPMVEPVASGVIYTIDPEAPGSERMIINAAPGLGDRVAQGTVRADTFYLSREAEPRLIRPFPPSDKERTDYSPEYISGQTLVEIAALSYRASREAGYDMDVEWAVDPGGRISLLQARRLPPVRSEAATDRRLRVDFPLIENGVTIFPGRAEGEVVLLSPGDDLKNVPRGAVVLVDHPSPEFAPILAGIAALLAREGNPVGHLATLAREFSVPTIFQLGDAAGRLSPGNVVSVDATSRAIFEGSRWPGMRERVLARIAEGSRAPRCGPLYKLILALNLVDPDAPDFKAKRCRSIHDVLRFVHEMAIRSVFAFGDEQRKGWRRKSYKLRTGLPMKFQVISLDGRLAATGGSVDPGEIESTPFQAFWRGFSDPGLPWPERWKEEMMGLPRDFQETILGGHRGPRRASDANYIMAAEDYLNFNARFAYHYAMVDAIVGPGAENNHLFFSFRSGGASDENRARRAHFLECVLRQIHFEVDRRGDIVTAWLRRYPQHACEELLRTLGMLMVCSRQLDTVLKSDASTKKYADCFLQERYSDFS